MFDISFGELLICAIVALLVLGPERLPGAVRTVGRWVGRARHTVSNFTDQIDREIRAEELKRRIEEEMRKTGVDDVTRQVKEALHAPLNLPVPEDTQDTPSVTPENRIAPPAAVEDSGADDLVRTPPPAQASHSTPGHAPADKAS